MVGKGIEAKSSRIFHQCYVKCCKLQNLTPLTNVIPTENGKVLDFCVDRIKYAEWPPILNALSCDLSLHSISVKCRQQVKTVLEHIDCERLAKTVNKRAVILTNFMLSNLVEALSQLLSSTTLLASFLLEGLPLKIPYLNPLCEAILSNSSLQHLYFPRCLLGDAGCLALCKAVRCLPNILTLDLSGCELTPLGAGYIADLVKYQKIHRYSENWVHTLRYRMPELDTMAGLRRITLCGNPQLGDVGVGKLLDVLADDLWIKALDVQNCDLTELSAVAALQTMQSNTTLVVLDMRQNQDISLESLGKLRATLRANDSGVAGQFSWLSGSCSSEGRLVKTAVGHKNGIVSRDRGASNQRTNIQTKYVNKASTTKKEKDYAEVLEAQLQEEISYRQQLEELNLQLVNQMRQLKQQQIRLWANGGGTSSGSEQSLQPSSRSCGMSSSSGSATSCVQIDQSTLSYIQRAFQDIYAFIKDNQCHCDIQQTRPETPPPQVPEESETVEYDSKELRINIVPKKAQSTHVKIAENVKVQKTTKSAHILVDKKRRTDKERSRETCIDMKPEMIEKQMGDTIMSHHGDDMAAADDMIAAQCKDKNSIHASSWSGSSDTLVEATHHVGMREALYSTDEDD